LCDKTGYRNLIAPLNPVLRLTINQYPRKTGANARLPKRVDINSRATYDITKKNYGLNPKTAGAGDPRFRGEFLID
jgi:hypothetical protein